MNFQGNSQLLFKTSNSIAYRSDIAIIKNHINDSMVYISKTTAQNILKYRDSTEEERRAYKAIVINYNRLKQKSAIQDTAYNYKEKEIKICRELLQNQQSQTDIWSIKSHQQSKEIKKQKTLKWIFIILAATSVGLAATK